MHQNNGSLGTADATSLESRARGLANQLEESAKVIRELCDALSACCGIAARLPGGEPEEPLSRLTLSVRARHCLHHEGIKTIAQLTSKTESDLLEIRNLSFGTLSAIKEELANHNLSLSGF